MRGKAMERKEILMVFMVLFYLCVLASSSSPVHQETLPSDLVQDKISGVEKTHEQSNYSIHGTDTSKSAIKHSSKLEHRIGRGTTNAGTRPKPGEGGSNGSPRTPTQGGTAFIPIYAAGAASHRHPNHHGAANCNRMGVSTAIAATITSLLHLYMVFRWG